MGVYIKGMDKPSKCNICPLFRYYYENGNAWCNALNVILESIPYEMRLLDSVLDSIEPHKDCPLIEVKAPHGRLIDEEAIDEFSFYMNFNGYSVNAPTVIEAEVE